MIDMWATTLADLLPARAEEQRLIAAASTVYRPRAPLALVLQYAAACMWDPDGQPCARIATTLAFANGLIRQKMGRPSR